MSVFHKIKFVSNVRNISCAPRTTRWRKFCISWSLSARLPVREQHQSESCGRLLMRLSETDNLTVKNEVHGSIWSSFPRHHRDGPAPWDHHITQPLPETNPSFYSTFLWLKTSWQEDKEKLSYRWQTARCFCATCSAMADPNVSPQRIWSLYRSSRVRISRGEPRNWGILWPRSMMEGVADPKKHITFTRVTLPNVVSELKGVGRCRTK